MSEAQRLPDERKAQALKGLLETMALFRTTLKEVALTPVVPESIHSLKARIRRADYLKKATADQVAS